MNSSRYGQTATFLDPTYVTGSLAGKVLITGGTDSAGLRLSTAEIYDPATGTFSYTAASPGTCSPDSQTPTPTAGCMTASRTFHSATLITSGPDKGEVLLAGGDSGFIPFPPPSAGACVDGNGIVACAELFNPATGNFTIIPSAMNTAREHHFATMISTGTFAGDVLVAGGDDNSGTGLSSIEIFDPAIGSFTVQTALSQARGYLAGALLSSGSQILLDGGAASAGGSFQAPGGTPVSTNGDLSTISSDSASGNMSSARENQTATLLTGGPLQGLVLIVGGDSNNTTAGVLASGELYSSVTNSFGALAATLATARRYHTATYLDPSVVTGPRAGDVLIVGGQDTSGNPIVGLELFSP